MTAEQKTADEQTITLDEIKAIRNQLPDNWKWNKCYELSYISSRTGNVITKKHWALAAPDGKGSVCSLGLISHDNYSSYREFTRNDVPVQFVEKSLLIVDSLLSQTATLQKQLEEARAYVREFIAHVEVPRIQDEASLANLVMNAEAFLSRTSPVEGGKGCQHENAFPPFNDMKNIKKMHCPDCKQTF